ncbi:MAG: enoyl-CoA hydratase/isomerase family protein [Clostridia bacterium]
MSDPVPSEASVLVEQSGSVATVKLNRPGLRNAIDVPMRLRLIEVFDALERDAKARAVILTGAGEHFSAGGDMKTLRERTPTREEHLERVRILNRLVLRLVGFPKPTIAAVDGYALGAGCNLALGCDLVIASDRARFGEVFAKVGLVPDAGASWLLPRLVGIARAKELVLTGDIIDAAAAERIGLVNRVVPHGALAAEAATLAHRLAKGAPGAQAAAKRLVTAGAVSDLATALEAEAQAQAIAVTGSEHREGLAALFEKREPNF